MLKNTKTEPMRDTIHYLFSITSNDHIIDTEYLQGICLPFLLHASILFFKYNFFYFSYNNNNLQFSETQIYININTNCFTKIKYNSSNTKK